LTFITQIILLLISPDFMNSDYCYGVEMRQAMERHKRGEALVIPVILRPVHWQGAPFSRLQALPRDAKPVTNWVDQDDAFFYVTEDILKALTKAALSSSIGKYWKGWHHHLPGCLILLVDQSESMSYSLSAGQGNNGEKVCDEVARVLNGFLYELIEMNTLSLPDGTKKTSNSVDIAVLGYSNGGISPIAPNTPLANKLFVTLSELQMKTIETEIRTLKDVDENGDVFEISVPLPIWVKSKAKGNAPMCLAFEYAQELAEKWAATHPGNYPPIVINLTGGKASDGNPTLSAFRLRQVRTLDGQTLLYNVLLSEFNVHPIEFPHSEDELPDDPHIRELFTISSIIPESTRSLVGSLLGREVLTGARGFIFAGSAAPARLLLTFIDVPAPQPLDPNT
jgi:hypothetical protein